MLNKSLLILFVSCLFAQFANCQENKLLISFDDHTTNTIKKGDYVRLSYPTAKLDIKTSRKIPELLGFRGKVDSIGLNQIWLRVDKRTAKKRAFMVEDIVAIKEVSKSAELWTFLGTTVAVGGAAVAATSLADLNSGAIAFAGVFSLFPAAILTANLFYPTKPVHKVGDGYTLKVITIN